MTAMDPDHLGYLIDRYMAALGLAPPTSATAAGAAEEVGEHVLEVAQDVADAGVVEVEAPATQARVPKAVVRGALIGVGQDGVRLGCLFEFGFGVRVPLIAIRVVLQRGLSIGLADVVVGGFTRNSKNLVIVALFTHAVSSRTTPNAGRGTQKTAGS